MKDSEELEKAIQRNAEAFACNPQEVVNRLVKALDAETKLKRQIQIGLDDIAAGRIMSKSEADQKFQSHIAKVKSKK